MLSNELEFVPNMFVGGLGGGGFDHLYIMTP